MRVPLSWLRDFAPFPADAAELASTLDDLGMVVEGIERVGGDIGDVVVARVLAVEGIPKAQRIRLVQVDDGSGDGVPVVCGAFNFGAGDSVAFARVGTVLPGGLEIGRRTIRGVESRGMICSPRELALGDDHDGILVVPGHPEPGTPLVDALGLTGDAVFDLAIEGNRPDALSIVGVARDAAARLRLPFEMPVPSPVAESATPVTQMASVSVLAPDLCPRFTARALSAVTVGPSAPEVARRLARAGMRSINNVVDASNYVMLELGQPTHPYDLARLPGRGLLVRRAEPGERLVTLDGVERRLHGDDCLICDAEGRPVGIGGVMGGASSEISADTTEVLLEAAYFTPMAIARTAKRLNLRTEASARFERGCDPLGIDLAAARFFEVLAVGQVAAGVLDEQHGMPTRPRITLRTARVNAIFGSALSDEEVTGYLRPIGFEARPTAAGVHEVVPPSFRPDIEGEIDLIEEVARHHGLSRIARTVPRSPQVGHLSPYQRERRKVRDVLVGAGLDEAITTALVGPGDHERAGVDDQAIRAANPLMQEESILRTSLRPGLLRAVAHNVARRNPDVRFFEVGHVFRAPAEGAGGRAVRDAHLPEEPELLGVVLAGEGADAVTAKQVWDVLAAALRLADVSLVADSAPGLHPGRTARVRSDGEDLGVIGEIEPAVAAAWGLEGRVGWIEVDLGRVLGAPRRPLEQQPLSRFPSSDIDLAFVVDETVPAGEVERTLRAAGGELLVDLRLFDVYRGDQVGPGRRSLAFRLRFCALDRTLTDDDVAALRARCIEAVEGACGATLRG